MRASALVMFEVPELSFRCTTLAMMSLFLIGSPRRGVPCSSRKLLTTMPMPSKNDLDGVSDAADFDCAPPPVPPEGPQGDDSCYDGIDNNLNGLTDGEDPNCAREGPFDNRSCSDGLDNDNDGFIDGSDSNCVREGPFGDPTCSDGLDNDGDGRTDGRDGDCAEVVVIEESDG